MPYADSPNVEASSKEDLQLLVIPKYIWWRYSDLNYCNNKPIFL